jgi:hypothetical protein
MGQVSSQQGNTKIQNKVLHFPKNELAKIAVAVLHNLTLGIEEKYGSNISSSNL